MNRRRVLVSFAAIAVLARSARAQQPAKVFRIGFLSAFQQSYQAVFFEALQKLGYTEGRNILIERKFAGGEEQRLPALASELVQLKVDAIVATHSTAAQAAFKATRTIPIVLVTGGDPVEAGLAKSFAQPGGNVTGTTNLLSDTALKQLELLRDALPRMRRVAVLSDPRSPALKRFLDDVRSAAPKMGLTLTFHEVLTPADLARALAAIAKSRPDGLVVPASPTTVARRKEIISFAAQNRIPAVYTFRENVVDGGLMSFGPNVVDLYRRAAVYVDKILKGQKPGDLPIEQPTKFDLVINLKTAKALGLNIPETLRLRAEVITE